MAKASTRGHHESKRQRRYTPNTIRFWMRTGVCFGENTHTSAKWIRMKLVQHGFHRVLNVLPKHLHRHSLLVSVINYILIRLSFAGESGGGAARSGSLSGGVSDVGDIGSGGGIVG